MRRKLSEGALARIFASEEGMSSYEMAYLFGRTPGTIRKDMTKLADYCERVTATQCQFTRPLSRDTRPTAGEVTPLIEHLQNRYVRRDLLLFCALGHTNLDRELRFRKDDVFSGMVQGLSTDQIPFEPHDAQIMRQAFENESDSGTKTNHFQIVAYGENQADFLAYAASQLHHCGDTGRKSSTPFNTAPLLLPLQPLHRAERLLDACEHLRAMVGSPDSIQHTNAAFCLAPLMASSHLDENFRVIVGSLEQRLDRFQSPDTPDTAKRGELYHLVALTKGMQAARQNIAHPTLRRTVDTMRADFRSHDVDRVVNSYVEELMRHNQLRPLAGELYETAVALKEVWV